MMCASVRATSDSTAMARTSMGGDRSTQARRRYAHAPDASASTCARVGASSGGMGTPLLPPPPLLSLAPLRALAAPEVAKWAGGGGKAPPAGLASDTARLLPPAVMVLLAEPPTAAAAASASWWCSRFTAASQPASRSTTVRRITSLALQNASNASSASCRACCNAHRLLLPPAGAAGARDAVPRPDAPLPGVPPPAAGVVVVSAAVATATIRRMTGSARWPMELVSASHAAVANATAAASHAASLPLMPPAILLPLPLVASVGSSVRRLAARSLAPPAADSSMCSAGAEGACSASRRGRSPASVMPRQWNSRARCAVALAMSSNRWQSRPGPAVERTVVLPCVAPGGCVATSSDTPRQCSSMSRSSLGVVIPGAVTGAAAARRGATPPSHPPPGPRRTPRGRAVAPPSVPRASRSDPESDAVEPPPPPPVAGAPARRRGWAPALRARRAAAGSGSGGGGCVAAAAGGRASASRRGVACADGRVCPPASCPPPPAVPSRNASSGGMAPTSRTALTAATLCTVSHAFVLPLPPPPPPDAEPLPRVLPPPPPVAASRASASNACKPAISITSARTEELERARCVTTNAAFMRARSGGGSEGGTVGVGAGSTGGIAGEAGGDDRVSLGPCAMTSR